MERKNKNKLLFLITIALLLLFSTILLFIKVSSDAYVKVGKNLQSNSYLSGLTAQLDNQSNIEKYVFIYLDEICMSCLSGWLVVKLDSIQSEFSNIKIYVLLPKHFTKNDIDNIKYNNSFKIDFISFNNIANINNLKEKKNKSPLPGLTIVVNKDGIVCYVDILFTDSVSLKVKLNKMVNHILHH